MLEQLAIAMYLLVPAFLANMAATPFGKYLPIQPIDGGKLAYDHRPIFGTGKTWGGLLGGSITGWLLALLLYRAMPMPFSVDWLTEPARYVFFLTIAFGALCGDIVKSYIKRRFNISSGDKFFPWDQLDSLIGATVIGICSYRLLGLRILTLDHFEPTALAVVTFLLIPAHRLVNIVAFRIGWKRVPY